MLSDIEQRICNRVVTLKDEIVSALSESIAVNTADPPGENYDACARVLADYLKTAGADVDIIQAPEDRCPRSAETGTLLSRPNVVGEFAGSRKQPVIHFNGHYDVVPATGDWTSDPYKPEIREGKLYGRGSSDMKSGIITSIAAVKALHLEGIKPEGTISFSFVPDEEYGDPAGAQFLIEQGKVKADYCIITEPSGGLEFFNGFKGSLWIELNTYGRAAHGSSPWRGINAFDKMTGVIEEINSKIKPGLLHEEGKELDKRTASRTGSIMLGGKIGTGDATNVVPSRCTMTVDRRLVPGEDMQTVVNQFNAIMDSLRQSDPNFNGDLKVLIGYNAGFTPEESPLVEVLKKSLEDITGNTTDVSFTAGGDIRFFHGAGIPVVLYGPGDLALAHKVDEYVEIDKLVPATQVLALTALRLCNH